MHLFVLSVIFAAAVFAFFYFRNNPHHNEPLTLPQPVKKTPLIKPEFCQVPPQEENDSVKVIVTYNDGSKETFINEDGEIDVSDSGLVTIRPDEEHCITISPYAFKKIEEIHE